MPIDWTAVGELSASFHTERVLSPRDNSFIRISGIGQCRRQLAYRLQGYREGKEEPPIWTHGLFTFDIGHAVHLQLQSRLANQGPLKWVDADPSLNDRGQFAWRGNCEFHVESAHHRIAGHVDGLSRPLKPATVDHEGQALPTLQIAEADDPAAKRYIIDIKTITARSRIRIDKNADGAITRAEEMPSAFERLTKPKEGHVAQTSLYAYLATQPDFHTDRLAGPLPVLPELMIIYVAKDLDPNYYKKKSRTYREPKGLLNSPYKIFTQPTEPAQVAALLAKARWVWDHVNAGTLPARDYEHTPERPAWDCVDCPFRHDCYRREGYFADDLPAIPPRLAYHLGQVDRELTVLG